MSRSDATLSAAETALNPGRDHGTYTDALWECWSLLNAHRAAVGPTYGITEEYMDKVVENAAYELGDFAKPWPPKYVRQARQPQETDG